MRIKEFRFLTTNDYFDLSFQNWSRGAEYGYILNELKASNTIKTLHNTACGFGGVHLDFARRLEGLDIQVFNSDMNHSDVFNNFKVFNLLKTSEERYDCCLCISVLEDFQSEELTKLAISNLLEQANNRLIITADIFDKVDVRWFWEAFRPGEPYIPLGTENVLTGSTSPYKQDEFNYIKILLIDVIK